MAEPAFFDAPVPVSLREVTELTGAEPKGDADPERLFTGIAPIATAGPDDICTIGGRYVAAATSTKAGACFCTTRYLGDVPPGSIPLVVKDPQRALAIIATRLFPAAVRPLPVTAETGISPRAYVDATARIEAGAIVEAGAVVGQGAEIGRGTRIGPNAVIGHEARIGRECVIGPGATILHALVGNRVIIHPGAHIGQDGYGFVPGASGHLKIPQIGRVIIQDEVEIGAGTTIDRGGIRDTVIGEGTKIDNLVQIGHNVQIGRRCLIVSQVGISGSAVIEDFVVIGGQTGLNGHITIGAGAQIAAAASVYRNIPPGEKWGGAPARPYREWLRAQAHDMEIGRQGSRPRKATAESEGGDG